MLTLCHRLIVLYSSSIPNKRQNSTNFGGAAINEYKTKSIAEYIRNTILTFRDTLRKQLSTLSVVRDSYIVCRSFICLSLCLQALNNLFI